MNFKTKFHPRSIFVFDIETIPDDRAVDNLLDKEFCTIDEKRQALTDYHLEITGGKNAFLRQPFHKVVAISFLVASIGYDSSDKQFFVLKEVRSGGDISSNEKDLVKGFFQTIDKIKPQIISFNGKTFDLPVLKYRAMKYGVSTYSFYKLGDKWENYNHRYSLDYHCDLIDAFSDFGISARVKLNEVCSIFGFPGKFGIDGSKVFEMYDSGQIKDIRNYCETDVLNTYLAYLRYSLHKSIISLESYNKAIIDLIEYLKKSNQEHFLKFYQAWDHACGSNFTL